MRKSGFLFIILLLVALPSVWAHDPIEGRAGRAEVRFLEGMIDHHQMALDMAMHCLEKAESEDMKTLCQNVIDAQSAEIATMQGWLLEWYEIEYSPMGMGDMMMMMDMMCEMDMGMMGGEHGGQGEGQHGGNPDATQPADHSQHDQHAATETPEAGGHNQHGGQGGHQGGGMMGDHMKRHCEMMMGEHQEGMPMHDMPMMMGMMAGLEHLEGVEYEIAWLEAMIDHHDDALHMAERIQNYEVHEETLELAQQIVTDQTAEIEAMEAMIVTLTGE